ncbi:zinc-ribbon domain-containing protein, partial [Escherichia coli]|nr:zinc-ribbon domain-containing protein [Escherichia coli]
MGRRKTHAEHVAEIAVKNPSVEIIGQITNVKDKVLTRCRTCGYEWEAIPSNLKSGQGCPICGKIKSDNAKRLTHTEQVAAIAKVNPDIEILGEIKGND